MTQAEIAKQLGVSLPTIKRWKNIGAPVHAGPTAVLAWMTKRKTKDLEPEPDGESLKDRLTRAQAEHYETKTDLARIKHKIQTGQLVEMAAVEDLFKRKYAPVAEYLKSQPDRLAARVNPHDPEHARSVLEEERKAIFKLATDA